jgi:hypothetical protein
MSIVQCMTTSYRQNAMNGVQNLSTNTLKLALYTDAATLGLGTTVYSATNEVVGAGYTAGGQVLTNVQVLTSAEGVVYLACDNVTWSGASFTARGALLYNFTQGNKSIAVLNFGSNKTCNNEFFTIEMSTTPANMALVSFS